MKRWIKAIIPAAALRWFKITREFWEDRRQYLRFSGPDDGEWRSAREPTHLEMQITKDYHRLEKALTLPAPRTPYGSDPRERIDTLLPIAQHQAPEEPYVQFALSAIEAQDAWNSSGELHDEVAPRRTVASRGIVDPTEFFTSRRSVRNYSDRRVDRSLVEKAIALAINTPSVCNRQSWRVRLFDEPHTIRDALRHQNGNAGFADTVPLLALITVDLGLFAGASERNQVYIDGGLFSMSLGWALHALGLDSCMLNMSRSNRHLLAVSRQLGVPPKEAIIMFVAIGYPRDGHRVARSPRRNLSEVVTRPKSEIG